jgi:multidrug efflux pump subunit AcrB
MNVSPLLLAQFSDAAPAPVGTSLAIGNNALYPVVSGIGFIMLAGVVVNNAIVRVDYIKRRVFPRVATEYQR